MPRRGKLFASACVPAREQGRVSPAANEAADATVKKWIWGVTSRLLPLPFMGSFVPVGEGLEATQASSPG